MPGVRMRLGGVVETREDGSMGRGYALDLMVEELSGLINEGVAEPFELDAAENGLLRALAMLRRCRVEFNYPRQSY